MATIAQSEESYSLPRVSQFSLTWRRFRKHKAGLFGLGLFLFIVLLIILVPVLSPHPYNQSDATKQYFPAGTISALNGQVHLFGTDDFGRDVLTRFFYAGRLSLSVALLSAAAIIVIGVLVGAISGFYGGWVDSMFMRFADILLSLPLIPVYLIAARYLRSLGVFNIVGDLTLTNVAVLVSVFGLFGWMGMARQVRASVISLRAQEFIEATRALGASNRRIVFKHLLPNAMAPVLVAATLAVGDFIILESILSYLGQGVFEPVPSWGNILQRAQDHLWSISSLNPFEQIRAYLVILPGVMILLTVLSINFIGEALRDALDPRQTI